MSSLFDVLTSVLLHHTAYFEEIYMHMHIWICICILSIKSYEIFGKPNTRGAGSNGWRVVGCKIWFFQCRVPETNREKGSSCREEKLGGGRGVKPRGGGGREPPFPHQSETTGLSHQWLFAVSPPLWRSSFHVPNSNIFYCTRTIHFSCWRHALLRTLPTPLHAAPVESQPASLFFQSLTIRVGGSVLNDACRRYEKYFVLGQ